MNITFISLMMPVNENSKKEKIKPTEEVSTFIQSELINGLESLECTVNICNKIHVGRYPKKCKIPFFTTTKGCHKEDIGFLNFPVIDRLTFYLGAKRSIKKRFKASEDNAVICYAMTDYNLRLLRFIKKKYKNTVTSIIVPDLPEYMHANKGRGIKGLIRKCYLKYNENLINKCKSSIDLFMLFSEPMAEKIDCKDRYMILEGVAKNNTDILQKGPEKKDSQKRGIFYGGGVSEEYGVKRLVDAFMMTTGENYELQICGDGNAAEYTKKMALKDSRIHYAGLVSYEKAQEMLLNSDVVVNPRLDGVYDFTKYSFPSKILDIMSYGKPLIGYKLEGIPVDYYKYLIFVKDHSIKSLANSIEEVCSWPLRELEKFGKQGQDFVLWNKNGYMQSKKIYSEISKIINNNTDK